MLLHSALCLQCFCALWHNIWRYVVVVKTDISKCAFCNKKVRWMQKKLDGLTPGTHFCMAGTSHCILLLIWLHCSHSLCTCFPSNKQMEFVVAVLFHLIKKIRVHSLLPLQWPFFSFLFHVYEVAESFATSHKFARWWKWQCAMPWGSENHSPTCTALPSAGRIAGTTQAGD